MKSIKIIINSIALMGLVGCGGGGSTTPDPYANFGSGSGCAYDQTQESDTTVQWSKLTSISATNLSEYNLFQDNTNPTTNPQERGLEYDLNVPLFTDYASKYRFAFIPPGCTAAYTQDEIFDFPIGTTLVKSFAMPSNTANRGIENENLIETRLIIKRSIGWVTLPYIWNADKTDAVFTPSGTAASTQLATTVTHEGVSQDFTYVIPNQTNCTSCHSVSGQNIPIGPKARFLNYDFSYSSETKNQLTHWVDNGFLKGLPSSRSTIDDIPTFNDSTDITAMSNADLQTTAKGWLDINCAHCHRKDPNGEAWNTNMHVEWNRDFNNTKTDHGVCQTPIGFSPANPPGNYIIEPGQASKSLLVFRMDTRDGQDRMPKLGRDLIHTEGVELISAWIDSMPPDSNCN